METNKWYVTMTDTFMSGWGHAEGKINKLVFVCDSLEQARIVEENANNRSDQKHVNIVSNFPYYNKRTHYKQVKTIADYPNWYKKGAF